MWHARPEGSAAIVHVISDRSVWSLAEQAANTADLRKSLQLGMRAIELAQAEVEADAAAAAAEGQPPEAVCYDGLVRSNACEALTDAHKFSRSCVGLCLW